MNKLGQYCVLVLSLLLPSQVIGHQLPNGGKIWALLVAGSNGFYNYRHQANVCHAYQILHANGIPDEHIIVMMYDDIAYNSENPYKGTIINRPNGTDVYKGVPKDYTGETVTPKNFLNILKGNKRAMKGIGSGRVIESGPNDHVFVNFVDHGGTGVLCFPSEELYASDLIKVLKEMSAKKRFNKMLLYVEACESGSMFENILPNDLNILTLTAASPTESSYACCRDSNIDAWLGDTFSVMWMQDTEKENLRREKIHHQFEVVRRETKESHVQEYGDLHIGSMHVADFMGFRSGRNVLSDKKKLPPLTDAVPSRDVPIAHLEYLRKNTNDPEEREKYSFQIQKMLKHRRYLEQTIDEILMLATENNEAQIEELKHENLNMQLHHFNCYKKVVSTFSNKCFKLSDNTHALSQLHLFAKICGRSNISQESVVTAINKVCASRKILQGIH